MTCISVILFGVMWNSWGTECLAVNWLLSSSSASSSSSHYHHHHRHQVGEEASLKKRLGSTAGVDEEGKKENRRKRRLGKKSFDAEKEEREEEKDGSDDSSNLVKKRRNDNSNNSSSSGGGGSSVLEGSRCSRVNGRGWRCCQQTLVGYALCEHHLGKGRLRSMISVRSHVSSTALALVRLPPPPPLGDDEGSLSLSLPFEQHWEDGDEGRLEEKLTVMKEKNKNKRKRIGTVKARSISSLLGQTNYAAAATED